MPDETLPPQEGELVTYYSWQVDEREKHYRSRLWYIITIAIGLALIIYSIFTANFLFAIMIILVAFIVIMRDYFPSTRLPFAITNQGILLGSRIFAYKDLKSFYIIYEPPAVKKIYFAFKGLRPTLSIDLLDNDPIAIREFLLRVIDEDLEKESQSLTDSLEKILKL